MPISWQCGCGSWYQFPDEAAGQYVRCGMCGRDFVIPAAPQIGLPPVPLDLSQLADAAPAVRPAAFSPARRRKKNRQWIKPAVIIGAVCLVALAGVMLLSAGVRAVMSAVGPAPPVPWQVVPDPQGPLAEPDPVRSFRVACPRDDECWIPRDPSRFVLLQSIPSSGEGARITVVDLAAGRPLYGFQPKCNWRSTLAISPAGDCVVGASGAGVAAYWQADSRLTVCSLVDTQGTFCQLLPGGRLVTVKTVYETIEEMKGVTSEEPKATNVHVWDIRTGTRLREFRGKAREDKQAAFSGSGRYVAWLDKDSTRLVIYEVATGQQAGEAVFPRRGPAERKPECRFCFSPDGARLLAMLHNYESARVLSWDIATGKAAGDVAFPIIRNWTRSGETLEWLGRDCSLVYLHLEPGESVLLDAAGVRLWTFDYEPFVKRPVFHPINGRTLTLGRYSASGELCVRNFEMLDHKARVSLHNLRGTGPARLRQGAKVGLQVEVGDIPFGNRAEAESRLHLAASGKLAKCGFQVADNQSIFLRVLYTEAAEGQYGVGGRFAILPEGPLFSGTKTHMHVAWMAAGVSAPLWTEEIKCRPEDLRRYQGEANAASARLQIFNHAIERLGSLDLPYFIPEDDGPPLPGKTHLALPEDESPAEKSR